MHLLRAHQHDPSVNAAVESPESRRLLQRHSEIVIALVRDGISTRTIRKHRLDDPRIADDVRTLLVEAAKARQAKAWYRRPDDQRAEGRLATLIRLGPIVRNDAPKEANSQGPERCSPAVVAVLDAPALKAAIQTIRRQVCEHFYLREMRDPELTVRSNRRAYALPRQLAMYITRHLTGASLQEIGREFRNRHHTTVLHSITGSTRYAAPIRRWTL
jgi:hypothetical protein